LDLQLVEVCHREVEECSVGDVPKAGCLEETIRTELVSIGVEAPSLVQRRRAEVLFDQSEKAGPEAIVGQQLEEASHGSRLLPVHQLQCPAMSEVCTKSRVAAENLSPPGGVVKFFAICDPREIDVETPTDERRNELAGTQ
jgi:hypothetical protein